MRIVGVWIALGLLFSLVSPLWAQEKKLPIAQAEVVSARPMPRQVVVATASDLVRLRQDFDRRFLSVNGRMNFILTNMATKADIRATDRRLDLLQEQLDRQQAQILRDFNLNNPNSVMSRAMRKHDQQATAALKVEVTQAFDVQDPASLLSQVIDSQPMADRVSVLLNRLADMPDSPVHTLLQNEKQQLKVVRQVQATEQEHYQHLMLGVEILLVALLFCWIKPLLIAIYCVIQDYRDRKFRKKRGIIRAWESIRKKER